ncbi:fumarate hydratase [Candidatus Peregrinibacteria bacterium]|nr:fumarate hydratase [Candidatus Peregrinibacteria bacterium]
MISQKTIKIAVAELCKKASFSLPKDVMQALDNAFKNEKSPRVQDIYKLFKKNIQIAGKKQVPACQDTGTSVVFVEKGDKVKISDVDLINAINNGVKVGYKKYFLRKSIVKDPLRRENTKDNTPAIIHIEPKRGSSLKITLLQKGGGAENCSQIKMLKPAEGYEGVLDFIVETVRQASSKGCPPYVIGVGIGGNFEQAPYLAKKSLLRNLTKPNKDPFYDKMEKEALKRINQLGIGPQGFGGFVTAIGVNIEVAPCHIASLPVAVNTECSMHRHASVTLKI